MTLDCFAYARNDEDWLFENWIRIVPRVQSPRPASGAKPVGDNGYSAAPPAIIFRSRA
jgi:hypothetical protein